MSNIGKQPIPIPEGVEVSRKEASIIVKGKLGELSQEFNSDIQIEMVLSFGDGRDASHTLLFSVSIVHKSLLRNIFFCRTVVSESLMYAIPLTKLNERVSKLSTISSVRLKSICIKSISPISDIISSNVVIKESDRGNVGVPSFMLKA